MTEIDALTVGDKLEMVWMANLLAQPELVRAVGINPNKLGNKAVRQVQHVLLTRGPAFAAPGPLMAELDLLPEEVNPDDVEAILMLRPDPEDVTVANVTELKSRVEQAARDRQFLTKVSAAMRDIDSGDTTEEVARKLKRYLQEFQLELVHKDHSAKGILDRLKKQPPKIRWQCGIRDLDYAFEGIGPDGEPTQGMLAQKEVVVLAAGYKAGKTREMLNWVGALLDQGANIAMFVLEDDEGSFLLKLAAAKFRVRKWELERYILDAARYFGDVGMELMGRMDKALKWIEEINTRLRIYDASSKTSIFKFDQALEVMAMDVALNATTHIVVDYVQQWGGEYKEMSSYAFGLRAFAAEHNVCMIEVSQFSNETIKFGSSYGMLAAKGAGEFGQTCHVGLELLADPVAGDREFALVIKVARDAGRRYAFCHYDVTTGTRTHYTGTPEVDGAFADLLAPPKAKKGGKRG